MAQAKKCDRCGILYEPYAAEVIYDARTNCRRTNGIAAVEISVSGTAYDCKRTLEVCPTCLAEFVRWIGATIKDENK